MSIITGSGRVTLEYCSSDSNYNPTGGHTFNLYSASTRNGSYQLVASIVNDVQSLTGQSSRTCRSHTFFRQTLNRWYYGMGGVTVDNDDWATSRTVCMGTCTPTPTPTNTPITPSPTPTPTPTNTPVTPSPTPTPTPTNVPPTNVPPTFGAASYSFSVAENAAIDTSVGAVSATDPNGDGISYSIVDGNTDSKFGIGTTNGNITLAGSLDHETTASYSLTARANDSKAHTDVAVDITVTDVNEPPDAPATPTVTANSSTRLTVAWSAPGNTGPDITDYDVQYRVGDSGTPTPVTHTGTATQTDILLALAPNTTYGARVLAKNPEGESKWSSWGSVTTPPAPTGLNVVPLPERKATLSWDAVANASGYVVEIRKHGETAWSTQPSQSDTSYEIVLDDILSGKGLGDDPYAYQFRVKANGSFYSEVVTIIDTPITKANGDSRNTTDGMGKATLEWTQIPNILGTGYAGGTYSFRYRKFGGNHSSAQWQPTTFVTDQTTEYQTTSRKTISGLEREAIYAIQLRYVKYRPGTQEILSRVYAGRDVYVWPSGRVPNTGLLSYPPDLVVTFPLQPILQISNKPTYSYRICESTFPENRREKWVKIIRHALGQWELATNELIALTNESYDDGRSKPCADYTHFLNEIARKVGTLDSSTPEEEIREHVRGLIERFKVVHIDLDPTNPLLPDVEYRDSQLNEVHLFDDMDETIVDLQAVGVFPEFSSELGDIGCWDIRYLACTYLTKKDTGNTSDIVIVRSKFIDDPLAIPGGDDGTVDLYDVPFNTCQKSADYSGNLAYGTLVHEAGHALGITFGTYHPGIADTIMNSYSPSSFYEIDCSPHPFDIMAIYALYQSR